jgi:hypothetical protein
MDTINAEMQQVMDRLARVERQNRWLVRGGLALVFACGSVLLMAQNPIARTIEAQAFVLKDATGKVRAELHMTDTGPELALYSDSQSTAEVHLGAIKNVGWGLGVLGDQAEGIAILRVDRNGPGLGLTKGQDSAVVNVGKGGSSLVLGGLGEGEAHVNLNLDKDGPSLRLRSAGKDNTHALLSVLKDGPGLWMHDDASGENSSALLSLGKDGSSLSLSGGALGGRPSVYLTAYKNGPNLDLADPDGFRTSIGSQELVTRTTGEKIQTSAASIHLFDPKGKTLWSAP